MDEGYTLDAPITVTDEEIKAGRCLHQPIAVVRSDQEMAWLVEYMRNGFNARQAARAVGYSEGSIVMASMWVRERREDSQKKDFWDIVHKAKRRRLSHLDATRERVMLEYARIAFFDPANMYDEHGNLLHPKDMPEDARRAIAGLDVTLTGNPEDVDALQRIIKIKLNQKVAALKDLSMILGITKETVVHEHKFANLLQEIQQNAPNDPLVVEDDVDD